MSGALPSGRRALSGVTDKDLKATLSALLDAGFDVRRRKAGHLKIVAPNGQPYFTGVTPGDHRGRRNRIAWARRNSPPGSGLHDHA